MKTLEPLSALPDGMFWSAPLGQDSDFTAEDGLDSWSPGGDEIIEPRLVDKLKSLFDLTWAKKEDMVPLPVDWQQPLDQLLTNPD